MSLDDYTFAVTWGEQFMWALTARERRLGLIRAARVAWILNGG